MLNNSKIYNSGNWEIKLYIYNFDLIEELYTIDKANVSLIIDDVVVDSKSVSVSENAKSVVDSFVLPNIDKGSVVVIRLNSVSSNGVVINSNSYYQYINE